VLKTEIPYSTRFSARNYCTEITVGCVAWPTPWGKEMRELEIMSFRANTFWQHAKISSKGDLVDTLFQINKRNESKKKC
jgi:hypothetical protein